MMKKSLFILTLIACALVCACNKLAFVSGEAYVSASFDVSVDDTGLTKAQCDGDGAAGYVNRCVLQVWRGDRIYKTEIRTAPAGTREFSFTGVLLEPDGKYDFLFWADCGTSDGTDEYYWTKNLKNVRVLNRTIGNNDAMDAFCGSITSCTIDSEYKAQLVLRRPFAQLNIITGDLYRIAEMGLAQDFAPNLVTYSYYACTSFDVSGNKTIGEPVLFTINNAPVYGSIGAVSVCTLAMAYLFVPEGESVSSVSLKVSNVNGSIVASVYDNIPFRSNWRTNIIGNLLTVKGGFSVSLNPMFDGEFNAQ